MVLDTFSIAISDRGIMIQRQVANSNARLLCRGEYSLFYPLGTVTDVDILKTHSVTTALNLERCHKSFFHLKCSDLLEREKNYALNKHRRALSLQ